MSGIKLDQASAFPPVPEPVGPAGASPVHPIAKVSEKAGFINGNLPVPQAPAGSQADGDFGTTPDPDAIRKRPRSASFNGRVKTPAPDPDAVNKRPRSASFNGSGNIDSERTNTALYGKAPSPASPSLQKEGSQPSSTSGTPAEQPVPSSVPQSKRVGELSADVNIPDTTCTDSAKGVVPLVAAVAKDNTEVKTVAADGDTEIHGKPNDGASSTVTDAKQSVFDKAVSAIDGKVRSDEGKRKVCKAFRIIGAVMGFAGGALGLAAGIMTLNVPLIVGAGILTFKGFFDIAGACTDGRYSLEGVTSKFARFCGASENASAWIGFGVGLTVTLAGIGCSLGGGITGMFGQPGALASKAAIVSVAQSAASKISAFVSAAASVRSRLGGLDYAAGQLSDADRREIEKLKDSVKDEDDEYYGHLKDLILLARRYHAESGGRNLMEDLDPV